MPCCCSDTNFSLSLFFFLSFSHERPKLPAVTLDFQPRAPSSFCHQPPLPQSEAEPSAAHPVPPVCVCACPQGAWRSARLCGCRCPTLQDSRSRSLTSPALRTHTNTLRCSVPDTTYCLPPTAANLPTARSCQNTHRRTRAGAHTPEKLSKSQLSPALSLEKKKRSQLASRVRVC